MKRQEFTLEEINAEMNAWNDWKQICSVQSCPTASRQLLQKYLWARFYERLKRFDHEIPTISLEDYSKYASQVCFCEQEFDVGLRENVKKKEHSHLCYKDYFWYLMEQSQDSPLKVLHGKLKERIHNIVDRWIRKNTGWRLKIIKVTDESGKTHKKRQWNLVTSIEEPLPNGDSSFGDIIIDEQDFSETILEEEVSILAESKFSLEDAAIVLAFYTKLLTSPELYSIVNHGDVKHGDEWVTKRKNNLFLKLPSVFKENFEGENIRLLRKCFLKWCFSKLKAEKRADAFLKRVNEKWN